METLALKSVAPHMPMDRKIQAVRIGCDPDSVQISGGTIRAKMGDRVLVYEAPDGMEFREEDHAFIRKYFFEATVIAGKAWLVAQLLNDLFGVQGCFYIEHPTPVGVQLESNWKDEIQVR